MLISLHLLENFYSVGEFNRRYSIQVDFLTYAASTLAAIKTYVNRSNIVINNNAHPSLPTTLTKIYSVDKGSKRFYELLKNETPIPNCCRRWNEKLTESVNWKTVFCKIHKIQEVKLKWLQIRILHRILATNIVLKEMGIVPNTLCNFCHGERENIEHIFWQCNVTRSFWNQLEKLVNEKCPHATDFRFTQILILFGADEHMQTDRILDYIILVAKCFLYSCKYNISTPKIV